MTGNVLFRAANPPKECPFAFVEFVECTEFRVMMALHLDLGEAVGDEVYPDRGVAVEDAVSVELDTADTVCDAALTADCVESIFLKCLVLRIWLFRIDCE